MVWELFLHLQNNSSIVLTLHISTLCLRHSGEMNSKLNPGFLHLIHWYVRMWTMTQMSTVSKTIAVPVCKVTAIVCKLCLNFTVFTVDFPYRCTRKWLLPNLLTDMIWNEVLSIAISMLSKTMIMIPLYVPNMSFPTNCVNSCGSFNSKCLMSTRP